MADEQTISELVGLPDGHELPNEHGTEVVVYEYDAEGNVTGWHKELKETK